VESYGGEEEEDVDPARCSTHARYVLAFVVSRFSAGNDLDNN